MFVKFARMQDQKELLKLLHEKLGSDRKIAASLKIPKSSFYEYSKGARIPIERFERIIEFLRFDRTDFKFNLVSGKEWLSKGGRNSIKSKRKAGLLDKNFEKMRLVSSKRMREMHSRLKAENREKYYLTQYERFKKIGEYKFKTEKGHLVRNSLEKKIANLLFQKGILYKYEPFLDLKTKVFFPDFKIGNLIIEATMWKGTSKAEQLKSKIESMKSNGFMVVVVIPERLERYYKIIEEYLVNESDLDNFLEKHARVAQTNDSVK